MAKKTIMSENGFNNLRRARNAVRRYCNPKDDSEISSIINDIRIDIPFSRILKEKYLEGIVRLIYLEELDGSQRETINDILSIISNNCTYQKQFNSNFNGMYFEDLCLHFHNEINDLLEKERQDSAKQTYNPNNEYTIHKIDCYEDAMKYAKYTDWCVLHSQFDYERNTHYGETFYVCLKDGFQNTPMEKGDKCPFDEYGLSMIAVFVRKNGRLASSTTRWNEALAGGKTLTPQQISQLIGKDFYKIFIPNK